MRLEKRRVNFRPAFLLFLLVKRAIVSLIIFNIVKILEKVYRKTLWKKWILQHNTKIFIGKFMLWEIQFKKSCGAYKQRDVIQIVHMIVIMHMLIITPILFSNMSTQLFDKNGNYQLHMTTHMIVWTMCCFMRILLEKFRELCEIREIKLII